MFSRNYFVEQEEQIIYTKEQVLIHLGMKRIHHGEQKVAKTKGTQFCSVEQNFSIRGIQINRRKNNILR